MKKTTALMGSIYTLTQFPSAPMTADTAAISTPANTTPVFTQATTPPIGAPVVSSQQTCQCNQLQTDNWWQRIKKWAHDNPLLTGVIAGGIVVGVSYLARNHKKR